MLALRIILLVIVFLIGFILFCPFSIELIYQDEVKLKVGYIFPLFKVLPQKPKPEKPEKKKPVLGKPAAAAPAEGGEPTADKASVDKISAAIILQGYLDRLAGPSASGTGFAPDMVAVPASHRVGHEQRVP